MKNIIKKILKEDDFDWLSEEPEKVIVINSGKYYPVYTDVMIQLGIDGVKEFIEEYSDDWYNDAREAELEDEDFLLREVPKLCRPKRGDICYVSDKFIQTEYDNTKIYKLTKIKDGCEFIMGNKGFMIYTD